MENSGPAEDTFITAPAIDFAERLDADIAAAGGEHISDAVRQGAIGATMFDLPNSEDGSLTVLLPRERIPEAPSQSLVRILSGDGRSYLGTVTRGPFAEPDSLRGDSHMLITVATRGGIYLPPYHGRVQVSLLGEEQEDGTLRPPLLRPLPNSPVFALDEREAARVLGPVGDLRLGLGANYADLEVRVPSSDKHVLPRHTAVLGTTGAGKSTTIARLVQQAQAAGMAVILLDVEGEYTCLHEPTEDPRMITALEHREQPRQGVPRDAMTLFHLVGRDTANPSHPHLRPFSLQFARPSPYTIMEILELSDAQQERFLRAYDIAKGVLQDLKIFPQPGNAEQERMAVEIDEFERGYPRLKLQLLIDVVGACLAHLNKTEPQPRFEGLGSREALDQLMQRVRIANIPQHSVSWKALLGKLSRLNRLRVFDSTQTRPLVYKDLVQPGRVSVIDLSDAGMTELSNIVIADLLQGVQEAQDNAYEQFERGEGPPPTRLLLIVEEAHEFLSAERIDQMPTLQQQVARIAKRGRKRWIGLVFVTQLPQHLPRQILGLVNSYILHKVTDPQVVRDLQRTINGIDDSLWQRLPGLAPGQAIVSFPHMALPLLVAMDPTPAKLRLID